MNGSRLLKSVMSLAIATGVLLLIPLLAMQFTHEVSWTAGDFASAGVLLFGAGMTYIWGSRALASGRQRAALAIAVVLGLLTIWAELAVGIFH